MKRIFTLFTALMLAVSFLSAQKLETKPKVGFLIANFINVRWYKDKAFFENKVKELGGIPMVREASNDPKNQLRQAHEMIDSGVQVLVVIPVDAKSAGAIVSVAHQNNVKVIAYDRLITNCDLDYYISFNSILVGEYMADYVTKLKPEGNYVFLNGPESDNNSLLINKGVMRVLGPHIEKGNIKLARRQYLAEWIELDAYLTMEEHFAVTKDVDVVITGGDILARGVLMSLDEWDLSGKVLLTGQNGDLQAIQDIINGRQTMTLYKSLKLLGERSAEIAMKVAAGDESVVWESEVFNGKVQVPSILFDPVVVDKDNIRETVIADGHLTEEEVYQSVSTNSD